MKTSCNMATPYPRAVTHRPLRPSEAPLTDLLNCSPTAVRTSHTLPHLHPPTPSHTLPLTSPATHIG